MGHIDKTEKPNGQSPEHRANGNLNQQRMQNKPPKKSTDLNEISKTSKHLLDALNSSKSPPPKTDMVRFFHILFYGSLVITAISVIYLLAARIINLTTKNISEGDKRTETSVDSTKSPKSPAKYTTTLRGNVGYPAEGIPSIRICAVDTKSRLETCTKFPASKQNYEYALELSAPNHYWVYWTALEWGLENKKFWVGQCPPQRDGHCENFYVTRFKAHPQITSIPNIYIGSLTPETKHIFE